MRNIFLITVQILLFSSVIFSDDIILLNKKSADFELIIDDDIVQIYTDYYSDSDICESFIGVLKSDINRDHVIYFHDDILEDATGKILISFKNHELIFYGFKMKLSYPNNKEYSPGIVLTPYFASGNSVGDTKTFNWDYKNKTFKDAFSHIP